ncbi:MAG: putative motility protein [Phycisphaerae bacterium]
MVSSAQSRLSDASLSPAQVNNALSISLLRKSLDAARQEGASAVQLIDSAAPPQPGDALVAKATGLGNLIDLQA